MPRTVQSRCLSGGWRFVPTVACALVVVAISTWGERASVARAGVSVQDPAKDDPAKSDPAKALDLATRYMLEERYVAPKAKAVPGAIGQYRVAMRKTASEVTSAARAGADKNEFVWELEFDERPAAVDEIVPSRVASAVRKYNFARIQDRLLSGKAAEKSLAGLTIWYRPRESDEPLILSLTPDRLLTDGDYFIAAHHAFMPELAQILPPVPKRVGDLWTIDTPIVSALLDEEVRGILTGKLAEVRPAAEGNGALEAVIEVAGKITSSIGVEEGIRAKAIFAFTPSPAAAEPKVEEAGVIHGVGYIQKVGAARLANIPAAPGRSAKRTIRHEMILERKLAGEGDAQLLIPSAPTPNPANSWLTYEDPKGRFSFRHPQDLRLPPTGASQDGSVVLARPRLDGADTLFVTVLPQTGAGAQPSAAFEQMVADFRSKGWDVRAALPHKLPEADFPGLAVNRVESTMRFLGSGPLEGSRMHVDGYLVQGTTGEPLFLRSTTFLEDPLTLRREIDEIVKTIKIQAATPNANTPPPR